MPRSPRPPRGQRYRVSPKMLAIAKRRTMHLRWYPEDSDWNVRDMLLSAYLQGVEDTADAMASREGGS